MVCPIKSDARDVVLGRLAPVSVAKNVALIAQCKGQVRLLTDDAVA